MEEDKSISSYEFQEGIMLICPNIDNESHNRLVDELYNQKTRSISIEKFQEIMTQVTRTESDYEKSKV